MQKNKLTMTCYNCHEPITTHLNHYPQEGQYTCPSCGEVFLDYRTDVNIGEMDKVTFSKHFHQVGKKQLASLQKLFPHLTPKQRAMSHFAAELLLQHMRQQLVKELFPEADPTP